MATEAQSQCLQCAGARTDRGRAMQTRLLDTVDLVLAAAQLSVDPNPPLTASWWRGDTDTRPK